MLTLSTVALFLPAAALVAATPGPSNFLCFTNGIRAGVAPSVIGLFGRMLAFAVLVGLAAAGLGAVLTASETAFTLIKWAGVAYLLYLGIRLWRAPGHVGATEAVAGGALALARKEFAVAITNPKAILIFTAFVPQFVSAEDSPVAQLFVLGAIYLATEFVVASGYVVAGSLIRRFDMTPARARAMNRVSGGMLLACAALLATAKRA